MPLMQKALILCLLTTTELFAGASTLRKGKLYVGYSYTFSETDVRTLANGDKVAYPYNTYTAHYFTILGSVHDRLNLFLNLPYVQTREPYASAPDMNALGDLSLGMKYSLYQDTSFQFAISGEFKTPASDYSTNEHTSIGNGQNDYTSTIHLSGGLFYLLYQNFDLKISYKFRDKDPPDQFIALMSYDLYPLPFLALSAFISHNESLAGPNLGDPGSTLNNINVDYTLYGSKLGLSFFGQIYFEASYSRTLRSRNSTIFENFGVHIGYLGNLI